MLSRAHDLWWVTQLRQVVRIDLARFFPHFDVDSMPSPDVWTVIGLLPSIKGSSVQAYLQAYHRDMDEAEEKGRPGPVWKDPDEPTYVDPAQAARKPRQLVSADRFREIQNANRNR